MDWTVVPPEEVPGFKQPRWEHPNPIEQALMDGQTVFVYGPRKTPVNGGKDGFLRRQGFYVYSRTGMRPDGTKGVYWWATTEPNPTTRKTKALFNEDGTVNL